MERDAITIPLKLDLSDFNSHAHVERDSNTGSHIKFPIISTHTLTWSVTLANEAGCAVDIEISTHTLTWSVTVIIIFNVLSDKFQLTRSRGA